jgi:hypothetical protein
MFDEIVQIASRQGVIAGELSDGVGETIDSTTSTSEILIGSCYSEEESIN